MEKKISESRNVQDYKVSRNFNKFMKLIWPRYFKAWVTMEL